LPTDFTSIIALDYLNMANSSWQTHFIALLIVMRYKILGVREQGAGTSEQGRENRQEARGKKSCVPHS